MSTYIALFRGINIGGKNLLPMKTLVPSLEEMGCSGIQTYIQSGNVVLEWEGESAESLARDISSAIQKQFGFEPRVVLLTADELEQAIANNPFPTDNGKVLSFFFLDEIPAHADFEKMDEIKIASEAYKLHDKVFYFCAPDGFGRSKLAANAEKLLGVPATARNWNTVNKLREMVGG